MDSIKKFALLFCITAAIFLSGCKVTKQISKQETQSEEASNVDSSATVKNDIQKESKIETTTVEEIDTTVQVNSKGEIVSDTTGQKTTAVKVRKTKTTKTKADIRETDQSKTQVEVKREEENKEETIEKGKVIEKTGLIPGWAWWLIALLILIALAWRFRKFFGW